MQLSRYVEAVQVLEAHEGALRSERLPDGRTTLVIRQRGAFDGDVTVMGPRTRALFKVVPGVRRAVVLQLKAGWAMPLFGVTATALTDQFVKLHELWGPGCADVCSEWLGARSTQQLLSGVARALDRRAQSAFEPSSARLARRAVHRLEAGDARVDLVAEHLGVTGRHLRRAFRDHVGIGPKEYARTVRLRHALRLAAVSGDWGHIAAHAGYYDQAHLIGEFRKLIGLTPSAFLQRRAAGL